ncbi:MAG: hypothetical protein EXS16_07555 [Gemmataceae bacterium]|nr:hypothetical protein [Gemmataceae bacterium]
MPRMVPHDMAKPEHNTATPSQRRMPAIFGLTLLSITFFVGGYFAFNGGRAPDCFEEQELQSLEQLPDFRKWDKPDVAIVLSGQMHGFIDKCGCSDPQYGGLPRRYNFVQLLKGMKWDVVGVDLGEVAQTKGIYAQNLMKFDLAMRSLNFMNYRAVAVGKHEVLSPLGEALVETHDEKRLHPRPISLSLAGAVKGQQLHDLNLRQYEIITSTNPKIGVTSLMGPNMREQFKADQQFLNNQDELKKTLKAFADAGVEIGIILHHEHPDVPKGLEGFQRVRAIEIARLEQAKKCAEFCDAERKKNRKIPPIMLMMVLTDESEAPMLMRPIGGNMPGQVVEIGHKGKYVGIVGVYRDRKGYRLQYQAVRMGPEWETKKGEEKDNKILALMEKYNGELKHQNMLAKYPRTPHFDQLPEPGHAGLKATFVGSERCGDCHDHAYKVWMRDFDKKTPTHSFATDTLEKIEFPAGRQHDPECMKCHTVGFKHPGGYNDLIADLGNWPKKPGKPIASKKIEAHNQVTRGVGCESCHGPGSAHVKNPMNAELYPIINPFKVSEEERKSVALLEKNPRNLEVQNALKKLYQASPVKRQMADMCQKCHDLENDVHWGQPGYDLFDKWISKKLVHHTPKSNNGAAPPPKGKDVGVVPMVVEPPPFTIEVIKDEPKKKPR